MDDKDLVWTEESSRLVFETRVFSVRESRCRSPAGKSGLYVTLDAPDWAVVVPVLETEGGRRFVMVRQWRHGSRELSLEFPGGVFEQNEDGKAAAARELYEETAYRPGRVRELGVMSPNPAIMANRVHFFLAEDLHWTGSQHLDEDEYVAVEQVTVEEAVRGMGRPPYTHALMAAALMLYQKNT
ncbi:MAG: NUDIX hydrolase [Spirochaetaceae bacterium]|jgi:8-oxo-dGTP pyrophosphatase MutT (NUDIX family)|nr:NUDIX hydrolase [Spirochaetaceae bacterium]